MVRRLPCELPAIGNCALRFGKAMRKPMLPVFCLSVCLLIKWRGFGLTLRCRQSGLAFSGETNGCDLSGSAARPISPPIRQGGRREAELRCTITRHIETIGDSF